MSSPNKDPTAGCSPNNIIKSTRTARLVENTRGSSWDVLKERKWTFAVKTLRTFLCGIHPVCSIPLCFYRHNFQNLAIGNQKLGLCLKAKKYEQYGYALLCLFPLGLKRIWLRENPFSPAIVIIKLQRISQYLRKLVRTNEAFGFKNQSQYPLCMLFR